MWRVYTLTEEEASVNAGPRADLAGRAHLVPAHLVPALRPLRDQLCLDGLLLVNDTNSGVNVHQS